MYKPYITTTYDNPQTDSQLPAGDAANTKFSESQKRKKQNLFCQSFYISDMNWNMCKASEKSHV